MGEHVMGRRQVLRGAGVAAGGVAIAGFAMASPAMASDDSHGGLNGSWMVTRQDDGAPQKVMLVLSLAGGNVVISHDINPAGPPFTGTWAQRDDNGFRATFWTGLPGGGPGSSQGRRYVSFLQGRVQHNTMSGTIHRHRLRPDDRRRDPNDYRVAHRYAHQRLNTKRPPVFA